MAVITIYSSLFKMLVQFTLKMRKFLFKFTLKMRKFLTYRPMKVVNTSSTPYEDLTVETLSK